MSGALEDSIDAYGLNDYSEDFLTELERAEEAFPSSFCAAPPSSGAPATGDDDEDDFDSMFLEPCSQEMVAALDEMEQPTFVPSQRMSVSQPGPPTRWSVGAKLQPPTNTAPCFSASKSADLTNATRVPTSESTASSTMVASIETKAEAPSSPAVFSSPPPPYSLSDSGGIKMEPTSFSSSPTTRLASSGIKREFSTDSDSSDSDNEIEIIDVKIKVEPKFSSSSSPSTGSVTSERKSQLLYESDSDSDDEIEITNVKIKTEPMSSIVFPAAVQPLARSLGSKRKRPSSSDTESDSDDELEFKKPKPPPPATQPHLEEFFSAYPKFDYDPSGPASQQYKKLRTVYRLERGRPAAEAAYQGFNRALGLTFSQHYGNDVDSLESWQKLCRDVEIAPIPDTLEECQCAIEAAHVNLVDLVDLHNTGEPVHRFATERKLSEYTLSTGKIFPSSQAYKGPLLRYLLRRIHNPPPDGVVRRGNLWVALKG